MPETLLVDSASLAYRAYFAVPNTVRAPDGTPVNGAYGFLNMLARLIDERRPAFCCCAWDDDWRPQWRVDLIDSYKTHRLATDEAPVEETIDEQIALLAEVLALAGVATVGAADYEAEDVIGALIPQAKGPVAIVSGDRDLFQLVRDPDVFVLYPKRGVADLTRVDETYIRERYGIPGRAYADFATLRGDPSDGLPGVRGIGEKSAAALIAKHGTLQDVVKAARAPGASGALSKVAGQIDYVERAARVVRIDGSAPIGTPDIRLPVRAPDRALAPLAEKMGLTGPIERLLAAIAKVL